MSDAKRLEAQPADFENARSRMIRSRGSRVPRPVSAIAMGETVRLAVCLLLLQHFLQDAFDPGAALRLGKG